ncbi:MAG: sugar phosphate isomerase/epimerase [Nitriliruptorales bacterium]|nr:sugar phosphate isomerase/epimerase [Nitriliruptorales bacterium]
MRSDPSRRLGAHASIWAPTWDHRGAREATSQAAEAGFSFIEIPLLDPLSIDVTDTIQVLDAAELSCTCSLGLPADAHLPTAPDKALAFLQTAIDVAHDLGSEWVTGALYGNLGTFTEAPPSRDELETVASTLREAANFAAERDMNLGIEVINRYETYLLNTSDQAVALLEQMDVPNAYVHLDTFHMNIEESSFSEAIHRVGSRLGYVHLAESHRGALGEGRIPFEEIVTALAAIGYSGPLVVEAFLNAPPALKAVTATWTDHGLSAERFAATSFAHMTALMGDRTGSAEA